MSLQFAHRVGRPMLTILLTLLATLSSMFRTRADLEWENVALADLGRLAPGAGHPQAGDGRCLASRRVSAFLNLEDPPREAGQTFPAHAAGRLLPARSLRRLDFQYRQFYGRNTT
jgi:hypothetical protein